MQPVNSARILGAPSGTPSCTDEVLVRKKEDCFEIKTGRNERIYELLGTESKTAQKLSIALVEIEKNGSSNAHLHPVVEECYIMLQGEARLVIEGRERILKPGDVAYIPIGKVHQIFNDKAETLKFYAACAPAWTPDCMKFV